MPTYTPPASFWPFLSRCRVRVVDLPPDTFGYFTDHDYRLSRRAYLGRCWACGDDLDADDFIEGVCGAMDEVVSQALRKLWKISPTN